MSDFWVERHKRVRVHNGDGFFYELTPDEEGLDGVELYYVEADEDGTERQRIHIGFCKESALMLAHELIAFCKDA